MDEQLVVQTDEQQVEQPLINNLIQTDLNLQLSKKVDGKKNNIKYF